jgi:hypothetical protein
MKHVCVLRPRDFPEPRKLFRAAQCSAIEIRRLLQRLASRKKGSGLSGSTDNADKLARLVINLTGRGRKLPAAEAIELAGQVELMLDLLWVEIDALLVSRNQAR